MAQAKGRVEVIDEIVAAGYVSHDPALPEPATGPEGLKQVVTGYRGRFPT